MSSGLISLKITEMAKKPDHLRASEGLSIIYREPGQRLCSSGLHPSPAENSISGILSIFTTYSRAGGPQGQ